MLRLTTVSITLALCAACALTASAQTGSNVGEYTSVTGHIVDYTLRAYTSAPRGEERWFFRVRILPQATDTATSSGVMVVPGLPVRPHIALARRLAGLEADAAFTPRDYDGSVLNLLNAKNLTDFWLERDVPETVDQLRAEGPYYALPYSATVMAMISTIREAYNQGVPVTLRGLWLPITRGDDRYLFRRLLEVTVGAM